MEGEKRTAAETLAAEVWELEGHEIEGGYRRLCGAMLVQAALVLSTRPPARDNPYGKEWVRQRDAARDWVDGGDAALPFAEACLALDMDEDYVRAGIERARQTTKTIPWQRRNALRSVK